MVKYFFVFFVLGTSMALIMAMVLIIGTSVKSITTFALEANKPVPVSQSNKDSTITPTFTITPTITPTPLPTATLKAYRGSYGVAVGASMTRLSQEDLDFYFNSMQELGVTWVRWDIDWYFVQKNGPDDYSWSESDRLANTASKYGINSLVTLAYAPKWAAKEPCSYPGCAPADPARFGMFAKEAAQRLRGRVNYFEIWNEPNHAPFWSVPNVSDYVANLKEAYLGIKSVNPNATVLTGGLAAIENGQKMVGISPINFVQQMYQNDAKSYFDGISLHPYTYPATPSYNAPWNHWQQMAGIRQIMNQNGDGAKKIWITEFGAATGGPGRAVNINETSGFNYGSDFLNEQAQSASLQDAVRLHSTNNLNFGPLFWYELQDSGSDMGTTENFFGLIRTDKSVKPAFEVFQRLISN